MPKCLANGMLISMMVGFISCGCTVQGTNNLEASSSFSEESSPVLTPSSLPVTVETETEVLFSDPFFGVSLRVPVGWQVKERLANESVSSMYSPCSHPSPEILPPCTKMQISLDVPSTMEALVQDLSAPSASYPVESRITQKTEIAGVPALWVTTAYETYNGVEEVATVYMIFDDHTLRFNFYGELGPAKEIIDSITLID